MPSEDPSGTIVPAVADNHPQGRRLSAILRSIAEDQSRDRVSVADLLMAMRDRALGALTYPPFEYLVGATCFLLAVILFLPIPFGNMLPALAICLFSLGILERDGVWILAGFATAIASVVLVWGVLYALIKSAIFIFANAFN